MTAVSIVAEKFEELRTQKRMGFMPFLTSGDPDLETTCRLIGRFSELQADFIELGFPYSDPIADGPVIQASYTHALNNGIRVDDILAAVAAIPNKNNLAPLIGMISYSIIHRRGVEKFLDELSSVGFAGLIVPDYPGDDAEELAAKVRSRKMDFIPLVAPATPPKRMSQVLQQGSGFVYCISQAGTTGMRDSLPETLQQYLRTIRSLTDLPLAVGFGISKPEQIEQLRTFADGAIVGSAIVKQLEPLRTDRQNSLANLEDYIAGMADAAHKN